MLQTEKYLIVAVETHQIRVGGVPKYVTSRVVDAKDLCKLTDDHPKGFAVL
jgi:hypothetical protein